MEDPNDNWWPWAKEAAQLLWKVYEEVNRADPRVLNSDTMAEVRAFTDRWAEHLDYLGLLHHL